MLGAVAKRYATALFELTLERGTMEAVDAQAQVLEDVFKDRQVRDFLGSPQVPSASKKDLIRSQLGGRIDDTLLTLVLLMIDKNRILALPDTLRYFDHLTDMHRGVEEITIVSAVPLSAEQKQAIVAGVKRFSDYENLGVTEKVDPAVLGGVKVQLGDHLVIDGTLAHRLDDLKEQMLNYRRTLAGA
ncbi:ATP synthase F1 subunit delta [bacterium]|nr:ATP synthase F1 subunit delta [bacterium]MCB1221675.1 ATP synthase F1 subunit delta [bacterium]UNM08980.1 MAG: ATP synthase F1 subunit delta [Planctomycetales bacterium]